MSHGGGPTVVPLLSMDKSPNVNIESSVDRIKLEIYHKEDQVYFSFLEIVGITTNIIAHRFCLNTSQENKVNPDYLCKEPTNCNMKKRIK